MPTGRMSSVVPRLTSLRTIAWRHVARARRSALASSSSSSSSSAKLHPLRLHPLPPHPLPPRVEHVILDAGGLIAAVLPAHIPGDDVDETTVTQLVRIGAVYAADVPPPKDKTGVRRSLRPARVNSPDRALPNGAYVRVHVHPKRFPAAVACDWDGRIIARGRDWVAVDKPPGVPAGPSLDNATECATYRVARALRRLETTDDDDDDDDEEEEDEKKKKKKKKKDEEEGHSWWGGDGDGDGDGGTTLTTTHRLDVATSGVLVLARRSSFAAEFNDALRRRRVTKTYECVTARAVPVGVLEHWTEESSGAREGPARFEMRELEPGDPRWRDVAADGKYSDDAFVTPDGRKLCVLRVLGCEETEGLTKRLTKRLAGEAGEALRAYVSTIELVTGRTHQIRAQLAAIGCPILGDVLYGGVDLSREGGATPRVLRDDDRLCLHAAEMRMDADSALGPKGTTLRAGPPWWRAADLERT